MERWHAYIDESYTSKAFCVGGFLAPEPVWGDVARAWSERIAYENRRSVKKGFQPISRYHATYCAHLKKEFSENNGWSIDRQIKLTKRLCEIIGSNTMAGFVVGGGLKDIQRHLAPGADLPKDFLYSICFKTCLMQISAWIREYTSGAQVKVFYERSEFSFLAREAFEMLRNDPNRLYKSIISAEPKGWEDCVPLQAADFMAYEGMKRVDGSLAGSDAVRKSLASLMNTENPIVIAHFQDHNFADLMKMIENKREGRPLAEGIESGLRECEGRVPYIPSY